MSAPHNAQLGAFLDHLQRGGHAGYYWTVTGTRKLSHWWNGTGRPEPPKTTGNLYFGVFPTIEIPTATAQGEPRPSQWLRSRRDLIAAVNCLFAEFDAKDYGDDLAATLAVVERLTPRPSVVVASGGGYHCYWLLDTPWLLTSAAEREHAKRVQYAWVDYTGGDGAAKDLARVLRLPGSLNHKYTPPRPVEFVWCELERLYTREALIAQCEPSWARQTLDRAAEKVRNAPDGQKHETLLRMARLGGGVANILGDATVERELYEAIEDRADDPSNAAQTIQDGIGYGKAERLRLSDTPSVPTSPPSQPARPGQLPQLSRGLIFKCLSEDEAGDAQLVEALYRGRLCYDASAATWYTFQGHSWSPYDGPPRKLVWSTVAATYLKLAAEVQAEAEALDDIDPKKAEASKSADRLIERAKKLRNLRRISSVLTLAQELLKVTGDQWDADPWILAVENGVLDLRTGQLRQGQPEDYIRLVAPTSWAGLQAPAPRWERFVSEVLNDEADRVAFLQRLLGFALNGTTKEHVLAVCVGARGRNGKRVLFETLQHVLGRYAGSVSTDVLIGQERWRGAGSAQPHLMDLQGRRVAYASETGEHDQLSAAQVKNITGGDPITARRLHENLVTFMPTHTIFLQTNRKPQAPADDDALWDRVKVLEFKVRFVDEPQAPDERLRDSSLEDVLRAEAPGILAWLVRGHLEWLQGGLRTPQSVKLARDKYRQEESIDPFLEACCEEWEGGSAEGGALYEAYKQWCELIELRIKSTVWFGKQLVQRFEKARITTAGANAGRTAYYGVSLRPRDEWTLQIAVHASTTLQSPSNPSMAVETPNNAVGERKIEGLRSISKSFGMSPPHEEKLLDYPSIPSIPSIEPVEEVAPTVILAPGVEQPRIVPDRIAVDRGRVQELVDSGLSLAEAQRQATEEARQAARYADLAARYEAARGEPLSPGLYPLGELDDLERAVEVAERMAAA